MIFHRKKNKKKKDDQEIDMEQQLSIGEEIADQIEQQLSDIIVNTLQRASEKPPIWWQWISLLLIGVAGGIGLGIAISYFMLPHQIIVPPQNISVSFGG